MANYTFTASTCYSLSTHSVHFSSTTITIKLTSTGQTVYSKAYGTAGIAVMVDSNDDFCVGSLSDNGTFDVKILFSSASNPKMWLVESAGANEFIGSDNDSNPSVFNKYDLNTCPVRLVETTGGDVDIQCPCESKTGACTNACYTYGT